MSDIYAPTKALRHLDICQAVRDGHPARPAHVYLLVSDSCNHRCSYCAFRDTGYPSSQRFLPEDGSTPRRQIPTEKALDVIDDCAAMGVGAIQFSGGGEPTTHPDLARMMAACRDRGIAYAVITNGTLIKARHLADDIARAAWVRVSLDTASPVVYAGLRGVMVREHSTACDGVRALREARDRLGTDCVIGVSAIMGAQTWDHVQATARLARELGADNISIAPQFTADGLSRFDGFAESMAFACEKAEDEERPGFRVFNRVPDRLKDLSAGRPGFHLCGHQFFTTYVGSDLNVYRCCVLCYNDAGLIGSIAETRFRDLWLSDERARLMAAFDAASCERCPYQTQGSLLEYVLAPSDPPHAHFV